MDPLASRLHLHLHSRWDPAVAAHPADDSSLQLASAVERVPGRRLRHPSSAYPRRWLLVPATSGLDSEANGSNAQCHGPSRCESCGRTYVVEARHARHDREKVCHVVAAGNEDYRARILSNGKPGLLGPSRSSNPRPFVPSLAFHQRGGSEHAQCHVQHIQLRHRADPPRPLLLLRPSLPRPREQGQGQGWPWLNFLYI